MESRKEVATGNSVENNSYGYSIPGSGDNSMIDVEGYEVQEKMAPLLKAIFSKYGDIAKESPCTKNLRSSFLQDVGSFKIHAADDIGARVHAWSNWRP
ncbi:hypothetical protein C2S53_018679 [Perilla frutescens var. hirtella]|uniref:Uncharacterized protein n=1 Tax=Perilla frutescens var. hirtella TaxID=608512 RepID=A0AAD4J2Q7_PERFH|nr:hypothetical protein C2S53_018679 [Perilla frutescens var. hirtella]